MMEFVDIIVGKQTYMKRGYRKFEAYIGYFLVPRAFECFLGEREGELEEQVETTKRGCCSCAGGKEPEVIATEAVAADGEAIVGVELDSRVGVEDASEKTKTSGGDANAAAGSFAVSASDLTDSGDQATLAVIAEAGARGEGVARFEAWRRAEGEEASGTCGSEAINSSREHRRERESKRKMTWKGQHRQERERPWQEQPSQRPRCLWYSRWRWRRTWEVR